ncbi:hypothetical protein AMECASPLE_021974 [Ameca splendens]|uniref:Uncharacterized protein n=1 Tax=Ameca splendens TaxID=208324 RepID=A0ABV0XGQ7_9TELE
MYSQASFVKPALLSLRCLTLCFLAIFFSSYLYLNICLLSHLHLNLEETSQSKHKPFPSATLPKPSGLFTCNSKLLLNGLIKKFKHDRSLAITPRKNSRRHKIIIEKYSNHYGIKIPVCQH